MYRSHPGRLTTPAPIGAGVRPWLAEQRDGSPGWAPAVDSRRQWPLTRRETEVLAAMAAGQTNAAIAETLIISRRAVEKHVNSIFTKLRLAGREKQHPRVQAVLIYLARANTGDTVSKTGSRTTSRTTWSGVAPRSACERSQRWRQFQVDRGAMPGREQTPTK